VAERDRPAIEAPRGPELVLGPVTVTHPSGIREFDWSGGLHFVTTLNAELVLLASRDSALREFLRQNLITVDGQWTLWALQRKYRKGVHFAKQSGFLLLHEIWDACASARKTLFILGAEEQANAGAVASLRRRTEWHGVSGFSPPCAPYPFPDVVDAAIRKELVATRPAVLVVAFGVPKQEFWARDNAEWLEGLGIRYVLFLGGAIDMAAGKYSRAPKALRELGLESPFRLVQAPRRWRRELRKLKFLWMFLTDKL
jgi:N-acetylglucosaminyldiphosphoundecaprenol N-acetyl-beta-D-mannosaminyltransferase